MATRSAADGPFEHRLRPETLGWSSVRRVPLPRPPGRSIPRSCPACGPGSRPGNDLDRRIRQPHLRAWPRRQPAAFAGCPVEHGRRSDVSATTAMAIVMLTWLMIGLVTGSIMGRGGHDRFTWWLLGAALGPLVLPLALAVWRHGGGPARPVPRGMPDQPDSGLTAADRSPQEAMLNRRTGSHPGRRARPQHRHSGAAPSGSDERDRQGNGPGHARRPSTRRGQVRLRRPLAPRRPPARAPSGGRPWRQRSTTIAWP
jgi:hypothetical protein